MAVLSLETIDVLVQGALVRCGASDAVARSVARSVVRAEADGIHSVGLGYLPTYLAHLRSGNGEDRVMAIVDRPRPARAGRPW